MIAIGNFEICVYSLLILDEKMYSSLLKVNFKLTSNLVSETGPMFEMAY